MFKKFIGLCIAFELYALAGAYLFLYVEECLPEKQTTMIDENFLDYLKGRADLNEEEKIKILNVTTSYQIDLDEIKCSYQLPDVLRWWEFTIVTCATIGNSIFHNITVLKGLFQAACLAQSISWWAFDAATSMAHENSDNKGQPRDGTCKACWFKETLN
eukprot:Seg1853.12 transcript_id=Seg1853.12/GoldUCD/mRNA.D3Y31 product="hypothetical protein" protein_id=Seg1853.12/GoldUCD/D3Y31